MLDQKALMQVYDHNQYQSTARAHRDAFYTDSVNGSHNLKGRKYGTGRNGLVVVLASGASYL